MLAAEDKSLEEDEIDKATAATNSPCVYLEDAEERRKRCL